MKREEVIRIARVAALPLNKTGARFALVGTAALVLHGHEVEVGDIDLLCESVPDMTDEPEFVDTFSLSEGSTDQSARVTIDGVKVDYIFADAKRAPFLSAVPKLIEGIPVATRADVIGLKRLAGRDKDLKLIALLEGDFEL